MKSGPGDLNPQKEMKIERTGQRSINSPYVAAASIKKATNGECITLVNIVSQNQSVLDYRILVHISIRPRCIVIKVSFLKSRRAICKSVQSLIKCRSDQVKKIKCVDS